MKADDHGQSSLASSPSPQIPPQDEDNESKQARRALLLGFIIGVALAAYTSKIAPTPLVTRKLESPNRLPAEAKVQGLSPSLQSQ